MRHAIASPLGSTKLVGLSAAYVWTGVLLILIFIFQALETRIFFGVVLVLSLDIRGYQCPPPDSFRNESLAHGSS